MQYLKTGVAATVLMGPFVDSADGVSGETGVTLGGADAAEVMKHDGSTFVDISARTFTHKQNGMYTLALSTGDTDTVGRLTVFIADEDVCLPVWKDFMVVNANVYDSLFAAAATDYLQVDAIQVEGTDATDQINAACDTAMTDYDAVVPADLPTNFGDLSIDITTGRVDVSKIEGTDATDQIRDAVVDDTTRIDASALNTLSGFAPASTIAAQTDVTGLNDPTAATIAGAVWDEVIETAHETDATAGEHLNSLAKGILARTNTNDLNTLLGVADTASTDLPEQVWAEGTRAITDKDSFNLAADQSAVTVGTVSTLTGHTAQTGDTFAELPANFSDMSIDVTTGRVDVSKIEGSDATDQIGDAVWDEVIETAHETNATAGEHLNSLAKDILARTNTQTLHGLLGVADSAGSDVPGQVWDETEGITGDTWSYEQILGRLYAFFMHKMNITDSSGAVAVRNTGDSADIMTNQITDNDTTTVRTEASWT